MAPACRAPRRRAFIPAATLSVAGLFAVPQTALADVLAPDAPASSSATAAQTMYYVMAVVGLLISLAVLVAILRAVRSSGGDAEPERRTRGTIGVQRRVGFGLSAAVLVIFVVGIVFTERARSVDASETGAKPITIQVDGQQWLWRYEYPPAADASPDGFNADQPYSYYDLVIPVDTPVTLNVSSTDVMHRWWVPALARPSRRRSRRHQPGHLHARHDRHLRRPLDRLLGSRATRRCASPSTSSPLTTTRRS